jgi:hypothetical protein
MSLLPLFFYLLDSFSGRKLFRHGKVSKLRVAVRVLTGIKGL